MSIFQLNMSLKVTIFNNLNMIKISALTINIDISLQIHYLLYFILPHYGILTCFLEIFV